MYEAICVGIRAECRACCVQSTDPVKAIVLQMYSIPMSVGSVVMYHITGSPSMHAIHREA